MMKSFSKDKRLLEYGLNESYSNIFCFSTTRHGGCSEGNYASFNCNWYCGDNQQNVDNNCETLRGILPIQPERLIIPHQVHQTKVFNVDPQFLEASREEQQSLLEGVDALMTNLPRQCLCISTADCIPVVLYDPVHQAIAVVHAGWRGTVACIVRRTIEAMYTAFCTLPSDIHAVVGPGISLESFEVGDEVYAAFSEAGFDMERISHRYAKWHIDLCEANRLEMVDAGVPAAHIEMSGICTYRECDDFFSARRLGIKSGRIITGVILREKDL